MKCNLKNSTKVSQSSITEAFQRIQDEICTALEECDSKAKFKEDLWQRDGGGGGRTRVIRGGKVFEKGGVNFSEVHGPCTEGMKKQLQSDADSFFATGVSIVIHPNNPNVPIIHMNIRYFELSDGVSWFGGGIDLTPHYIEQAEAVMFHSAMKALCDRFDADYHTKFKAWADDYFFIPHRDETRGIGGIFFDHLGKDLQGNNAIFDFTCAVGRTFAPLYTKIVNAKKDLPFTPAQKEWQGLRRGRYVEFNLVHDRGTRFGLVSNGRTESILMSLPANASWEYMHEVEHDSPEQATLDLLKKGINWLAD